MRNRTLVTVFAALFVTCAGSMPADAQTNVRFVLDFLLQGQQSPFVLGRGGNAPIRVRWVKHRGPGDVKVADASPAVVADPAVKFTKQGDFSGKSTTTATFSAPGEYWVRGQFNDSTGDGGGGDQCCWTNVLVKVNIRAAGTPAAR